VIARVAVLALVLLRERRVDLVGRDRP
jgi:hypothetical protein